MAKYKDFKDKLSAERKKIALERDRLDAVVNQDNKKRNLVTEVSNDPLSYPKNFGKLSKTFPMFEEQYQLIAAIDKYMNTIKASKIHQISYKEFKNTLKECIRLFKEKRLVVKPIIKDLSVCQMAKVTHLRRDDRRLIKIVERYEKAIIEALERVYKSIATKTSALLTEEVEKEIDSSNYEQLFKVNAKLETIDYILSMFTYDTFIGEKCTSDDMSTIIQNVTDLLTKEEIISLLTNIKLDIRKRSEVVEEEVKVDFDNLDLSKFSREEQARIEELREIIEDEDLEEKPVFNNADISYNERLSLYHNASINDILLDVKQNLLEVIYDKKEEVLKIFRLIIDKYKKYNLRLIRIEKETELLRLKNDFNNIISFINKTYTDREDAYNNTRELEGYTITIDKDYLPLIKDMIDKGVVYDYHYDEEIDKTINEYKKIIRKWKKIMSATYSEEDIDNDCKEDTDNLVFCITDIDLSTPGFDKEFTGTVDALESRSSHDLKKRPGRRGMTRLRKTTDGGREKDFVQFLEGKDNKEFHFVPYRYSSDGSYRTGLIKFEPSKEVKEFLEERYGLSKQSAYYGIFQIISSKGANHSEYYYLERYVMDNYEYIEEVALLLASDKPDYEKIIKVIDDLLLKKKNSMKLIQETK